MGNIVLNVSSEYGRLRSVLVSTGNALEFYKFNKELEDKYGSKMREESKYHPESGIPDISRGIQQHSAFLDLLKSKGVELIFSNDVQDAVHQVFTRDIGFVIGDTFFYSVMGDGIRKIEQQGLEHLNENFKNIEILEEGIIEGGDVFVHGNKVFVGITKHSTNWEGFNDLKKRIEPKGYQCIPIRCKERVLHLDCRFNIISENCALLFRKAIHPEDMEILEDCFDIIELKEDELETLGSNMFIVSPKEIVLDKRNSRLCSILREKGFNIIELDYSEITKLWGAFRCTTLPLNREHS